MRLMLLALAPFCLAPVALAQEALPDPAAVAEALDQHPMVIAAQARVRSAAADARALAKGPHEFSLTAGMVRRTVDTDGRFTEYDALLTRPVRLPGKASLDRQIGRHGLDAAENQAEDARHQAALVLAEAWWDWISAASEARIDEVLIENHQRLVAAVGRREKLGDASRLEADQAEAALATARIGFEQSRGRALRARARLATQFPHLALPVDAPPVPEPDASFGNWEKYRALNQARKAEGASEWVDPKAGNRMITVHGFRSTFRDWAGEQSSFPREVIEHALAHGLADKTEAAYQRGSLLVKRRKLMDAWASFSRTKLSATVVPFGGIKQFGR